MGYLLGNEFTPFKTLESVLREGVVNEVEDWDLGKRIPSGVNCSSIFLRSLPPTIATSTVCCNCLSVSIILRFTTYISSGCYSSWNRKGAVDVKQTQYLPSSLHLIIVYKRPPICISYDSDGGWAAPNDLIVINKPVQWRNRISNCYAITTWRAQSYTLRS